MPLKDDESSNGTDDVDDEDDNLDGAPD